MFTERQIDLPINITSVSQKQPSREQFLKLITDEIEMWEELDSEDKHTEFFKFFRKVADDYFIY